MQDEKIGENHAGSDKTVNSTSVNTCSPGKQKRQHNVEEDSDKNLCLQLTDECGDDTWLTSLNVKSSSQRSNSSTASTVAYSAQGLFFFRWFNMHAFNT